LNPDNVFFSFCVPIGAPSRRHPADMQKKRAIFFISDRTAITAETLGLGLLTQFDHIHFEQFTLPFVDTLEKARFAVMQINNMEQQSGARPLVFSTLINQDIRQMITTSKGVLFDFFDTFMGRLEEELRMESSHTVGRYHGLVNDAVYNFRIDAMNFALVNDDGISTKEYDRADIILVGVSRAGKTPTCLYLGLQFGVYAANYPLTEEDLVNKEGCLPQTLAPFRKKLFGLTISPDRLQRIRAKRRAAGRYASIEQCQMEVSLAETLFQCEDIPFINITVMSVEEIAATILHECNLQRRLF
jgi:[pyruvate, water dikinase]-phosphate phosphotransferase / [pyruvate, water dikinase] kinase